MSMISEKLRKARQGVKEEDTPAAQALRLAAYGAASGRLREQEEQEAQGLQSLRLAAYGAATGRGPSVAEQRETPFKAASRSPAGMVTDSGTGTSVAKQEYEAGKERARYLDFSTGAELQRRLREAEDALSLSGGGRAEDAAARAAKAELDKWQSDVRAARGQETFGEHALNLLGDAAAGFMRGVGNPVEAMARLMELPEDALYWITGDERFNQDSPDRLTSRASKALTQSSEDTFSLSRPAEERPMLERALVQTAQAAGNMLSAGAIYGQAFDTANTAGLEATANATPELGASLASRAATAVTSAGARAGLEILRNPGNFGISLGSGVNAYSEALGSGADFGQAVTNGFAKGLTEYFSNKLFSGTPFENNPAEKGYVTRLTEHIAQKIGKSEALAAFNKRTGGKVFNWVMDKTGEGMEEVVTAIADPLIDRLTYDEDADFATADELVEEFLGGILLSLAMSPAETLADNVERHRVGADLLTGETVGQIGDVTVPGVDEATAALIESGLESPEGTESRRLAERAMARAQEGKEISARMRGELAAANAAQVASEESAATEVAQEERPTGDRGRQIVTEGNPRSGAAPTENEAARAAENVTLTAEDRVNAAISAEERSLDAMERTAAGMGLGENGAAYLRASYRGGDAAAHLRDYVRAYNAGVTGEELGTATNTQRVAWNAGRMDAAQSVRDNGKAVVAKKPGLVRDASFKAANISAEQERALDVLGRVTGSEIRFGRLSEDENARYDARSATITVNVNAKDPVMAAATHEIVHRIRDVSPEAYRTLRQFVVDNMSDRALAVSTKVTGKVYETNDVGYITEEMVANAFGRMAENNALLDQFVREHRTAAQRVLDALRDLIDRVRTALRRGPTQRSLTAAQNREFEDLLGRLEEAQRTMEAALETAEEIAGRIEAGASPQMAEESGMKQSRVTDAELLRDLESGETVTVYRAMQLIDGKLYPPMAAKVKGGDGRTQLVEPTEINVWYQSDERPDLVKNGKFTLNKGNGSSIAAAYNPYFHTSASPLNDQFSSAYNRPNLVVVEGVIPRSELTSGYRAEGAKDSVGETKWHAGPVASKLKGDKARRVFLSRWFMAQRIVPDAEVARVVANTLRGEDVAVPTNVVTPSLLAELRKQGVNIAEDSVRYSLKERDDAYAAAVEGGDMETAQRMVDEAAKAAMPGSKIRTPEGKLRVVYHGTNSGDFTVFDRKLIGTAREGDTGFFGRGFYFAYSKGEASMYGRKVIPAYLDITNPFNFETELNSLEGQRTHDYYASAAVFAVNFAEKFPELADQHKVYVGIGDAEDLTELSLREFADAFLNVYNNTDFQVEPIETAYGTEWLVTADKKEESFTDDDGKTHRWIDYGFQQRYLSKQDAEDKLGRSYRYLSKSVYDYVDIPRSVDIVQETDFSSALQKRGYDGVIQSVDGDEVVAFSPNQIKSADPVTYDDDGNVIPLSERFNPAEEDIRYSRATDDYGRALSEAQAEYFAKSVVRDGNGLLKVMYHGTSNAGFTVFDRYHGRFGLFGTGYYFTDSREVAEGYTRRGKGTTPGIYEVYLNITNPIDMDAPADLSTWREAFRAADYDESYLDGIKTNEDAFRALKEYCQDAEMYRWEAEEAIEDTLRGMGYDGITHTGGGRYGAKDGPRHTVYIAFDQEQIKRTDNLSPTGDPDIRYSLKERDDAYAAAVEGGDMETAQRMVDEAAKAAGYKRAGKWYTRTGPVPMHGRNGTYNAYRVGITRGDGAVMIHVGDDEAVVIENYPSFRDHQRIVLEELADAVYGKFTKLPFRFIRATNNKDEIEMAKAGKLKPSYNFRDSYTEKGISVSDHFGYVSSGEYKYGYYLDGRIVGYGSDGEPVLDPTTITVIGKLMDQADIDKEIKAYWGKTDAALAERGWSAEAFGAITSGFLSKIYLDEDVKPADREDIRRSRSGREILDEQIQQFGAIPEGENPVRDVPTPVKTSDRQKLSQTVRTVLEAQATPGEMVPTIEKLTADGTYSYTQYSDKAAIQNAEDYVKDLGWAKAYGDWLRDVQRGVVNKTNTAIGWALYNNAANSGDTESALTVLDAIVKHQRAAAQAVQATRILKKLSPETQLYNVAKSVQRLQEEINQRYGEEKGPKLKVDPKLGEEFLNAGTDEQRAKVLQAIYKDIGRQMPTHFMDRWNAWRYLAMLGNPRTHVRNILGNAGFAPVVAVKDLTATAIEAAVDRVSGGKLGRTKGNLVGKGGVELLQAAWKDYDKVADQALGGGKYQDGVDTDAAVQEGRIIFGNTGAAAWDRTVGRALERARRFNGTALDKEDVWFSKPHYALALAQYCKANKITPEMIAKGEGIAAARAYAIKEAQKATYRDTNQFSQAISRLGRGSGWDSNRVTRGVSTVIEGILPFRKTPANILARGVEYSPLGLLRSLTVDMIGLRNARIAAEAKAQGKKPPKFRVQPISGAEMIDHLAAGLTGTGLVMLGAWLASLGLIRGHGGDDDKRRKQDELMGHQNYALELPDGTSITLDWLAPECLPFFIGVNLWEQGQEETDGPKLADILSAVGNVTEPMLEMSCLQSLNAVFDTVGYAKEGDVNALTAALASAATSYLTQALPTLAGQGERTAEDKRYTTYADKNSFLTGDMQYTLGKASARIPGLDYGQIPYIDAWGREELTGSFLGRAFNNFINPSFTSRVDESAMEKELLRLYEATGESVLPQRAPRYFNVDKERKDLTGDEYVTYATARGRTAYTVLGSMVTSSSYKALSDANKARAVEMAYTYANQTAMTTVGGKISTSYKWVSEALEAKKKGVSPDKYILIYTTVTPIGGIPDADGKTIDNSRGLQRMEAIYNVSGLTDDQRRYLFECFDVGKTVIDYNKAKVEEELKKMRGK